ncbi:MAG: HD domain-containing protein [Lachnospiraceae bacterium]|nr:HD domain-containing protein [Lachnospiraceae bacterium]
MALQLFAAVDIGSFELELSIFEAVSGKIRCVERQRHVIALGSDTYQTGVISHELLDELCDTLNHFVDTIRVYKIDMKNVSVYATSALREAKNRLLVEDRIRVSCGLKVTVLSNSEQRFMCYKAIPVWQKQFDEIIEKESAIVDVGFGSMQISLYNKGALQSTQNLHLGALRTWTMLNEVSESGLNSRAIAEELIDYSINKFNNYYLQDKAIKNIIAIGDCMRIFAAKIMKLSQAESISALDFINIYEQVLPLSPSTLAAKYDVPSEFAKLVIPVAMIYYRIIRVTGAKTLWIPVTSLSEGMATEWAQKQKLIKLDHDFNGDILSSARFLNKKYSGDRNHTEYIEDKCMLLFDATKKLHGLGKQEKLLLQLAAILHDCGKFVSITAPGQCAYDIIMASEILGISHEERKIVANIVKYNTMPFDLYDAQMGLPRDQWMTVYKLTALLRLANALDRSHKQKIENVQATLKGNRLIITALTDRDIELEAGLFHEKSRFFSEVYGVTPELKRKKL